MKLKWDHYSDQPEVIRDRALKKNIYKTTRLASLKLLLINLIIFPVAFLAYAVSSKKPKQQSTSEFFGMSINLDKNPDATKELIKELGVNQLLIRVPLADIENLAAYIKSAEQFSDKDILINILQDRPHVEDLALLRTSLERIFKGFSHLTLRFQIANAINRKKWAFFSMDEYLAFYQVAYDLKQSKYPKLILLGSSVIDFEYYFTIRTLFNRYKYHYDQFSSLLYVDRRGAPENTQMGLDLRKKLFLLHTLLTLSPKGNTDIVITETNWPIQNTAPYAPTSEKECVDLEAHANFLVRYYLLALSTGVVKNVYWHQLIAPGYGLIDNRHDELVKYPAYYAFKHMLSQLNNAQFLSLKTIDHDIYQASFKKDSGIYIDIFWTNEASANLAVDNQTVYLRNGKKLEHQTEIHVSQSPIYVIS